MGIRKTLIVVVISGLWLMGACEGAPAPAPAWRREDTRMLGDPDVRGLAAGYARRVGADLEIRLDFLRSPRPGSWVRLALDTQAGGAKLSFAPDLGERWEMLVEAPARGTPRVVGLMAPLPEGARARVDWNPRASMTVRLARSLLPPGAEAAGSEAGLEIAAFLEEAGEEAGKAVEIDRLGPFRLDGPAPKPARLLLVFWDCLPSATPAQALRRWDGAHTGPYGQRHGLRVLLEAARRSGTPLAMLDLKRVEQLAALEALGGLELVRSMSQEGLVMLTDEGGGGAPALLAAWQEGIVQKYRLGSSLKSFSAIKDAGPIRLLAEAGLRGENGDSGEWDPQADEGGLTPQTRAALLRAAISDEEGDVVVLGGSLPGSAWGDLLAAGPAFDEIAARPWIQPLDEEALLALMGARMRAGTAGTEDSAPEELAPQLAAKAQMGIRALEKAPDGLFTRLGWQTYHALSSPTSDERLAAVRAAYLGDVAYLARAQAWAQAPHDLNECDTDLDGDGGNECVLASREFFLIAATRGARMVFAAAQSEWGVVQLVGPRSQLAAALGDSRDWKPGAGLASDPQEIPGGFADQPEAFLPYTADRKPADGNPAALPGGQIEMRQDGAGLQKRFRLEAGKIVVEIEGPGAIQTRLPLLLLDERVYEPGWLARYQAGRQQDPFSWSWELRQGVCLHLKADGAQLQASSFNESLEFTRSEADLRGEKGLPAAEDPNLAYPAGHWLPFPLAVVDIRSEGRFSLELSIGCTPK